jgi:hypothetical protein
MAVLNRTREADPATADTAATTAAGPDTVAA